MKLGTPDPKKKALKKHAKPKNRSSKVAVKTPVTQKKKSRADSHLSDSTSVSSVVPTDMNTSSDLSLRDIVPTDTEEAGVEEMPEKPNVNITMHQLVERAAREMVGEKENAAKCNSIEDKDINKYVAVYYSNPPRYYWGKVKNTFSQDPDSPNDKVEIDYLKKATLSANPADWTWAERINVKDIGIIDTKCIVYGPVLPNDFTARGMKFPDVAAMEALGRFQRYTS